MRKKKASAASLIGILVFFITSALVVTIAIMSYATIASKTDSNGVIAAVMFVVVIILAILSTIIDLIRRKVMIDRPVKKILEATDKIASGDFSVRMEIAHAYNRYDEYDYIMENLNKMTAELSKMAVLNNDFVSNISHELKTPIAIIQNYAVSIQDEKLDVKTRGKYVETIISATKRLTTLVTNILKLNKLEHQELSPEFVMFKLDEMIAQTVISYEDLIENKNLVIDCDLEEIDIFSSPSHLEIVWNNLLSNAIKFTENGGKITVSLKRNGDKVIVKVSDTGCGIDRDTGRHIFDKFYQGDTSHSKEGNGLGLTLVKKVIDVIGGEISVESEPGEGSTFTVILRGGVNE